MSAESFEQNHSIFRIAALKDVFLEGICCLLVENTFLLKQLPCISLKHLAPKIRIITRCIAIVSEYMLEIWRTVAECDLLRHTDFLCHFCLKRRHVYTVSVCLTPFKVKKSRACKLCGHEALIELG